MSLDWNFDTSLRILFIVSNIATTVIGYATVKTIYFNVLQIYHKCQYFMYTLHLMFLAIHFEIFFSLFQRWKVETFLSLTINETVWKQSKKCMHKRSEHWKWSTYKKCHATWQSRRRDVITTVLVVRVRN